jgi:hypothetical protein
MEFTHRLICKAFEKETPMWRFALSLALVASTSGAFAGETPAPAAYPDLSEPKAAAFSLGVALATGDAKTAHSIYIGDQKEFSRIVDAFAKAAASAEKFSRIVTAKYGKNAATLVVASAGLEPKLQIAASDSNVPLTALISAAEVKLRGEEATLVLGPSFEMRLKKENQEWKVVTWPPLPPLLVVFADAAGSAYEELAGEIERGKYQKAHEVSQALGRALQQRLSKFLKDGEQKR